MTSSMRRLEDEGAFSIDLVDYLIKMIHKDKEKQQLELQELEKEKICIKEF